jgi:hypothetical protein
MSACQGPGCPTCKIPADTNNAQFDSLRELVARAYEAALAAPMQPSTYDLSPEGFEAAKTSGWVSK